MAKKKFKVWAKYTTYCWLDVEADNKEEAEAIAKGINGGNFEQSNEEDCGDWEIVDTMTKEVE